MDHQGPVDGVTLGPVAAVEHHRGHKEQHTKGDLGQQGISLLFGQYSHQAQATPGQNHIQEDGEQLVQVQVWDIQIGNQGNKVEVRHIVIAYGLRNSSQAAALPDHVVPLTEEGEVIIALMVQQQAPHQHSRRQREKQYQNLVDWNILFFQQQSAQGCREHQAHCHPHAICHAPLLELERRRHRPRQTRQGQYPTQFFLPSHF